MSNKSLKNSEQKSRPLDSGANYNAFGRDPYGYLTYMSALFFGPDYVPPYAPQQFAGPPEPPRFGPPASYQIACLPLGWRPRAPPNFYGEGALGPPYLDPPRGAFDPETFAALKHIARFCLDPTFDDEDVDGYLTDTNSEMEQDVQESDEDSMAMEVDEDKAMEIDEGMVVKIGGSGEEEMSTHDDIALQSTQKKMDELVEGIATVVIL